MAGVVTNSFLVAFTSSYGRSWEGDILTTNRTETVFNNVTNTSETIFIITEHIPAASRLWLIIGFEVSRCFVLLVKFSIDWSAITDNRTLLTMLVTKKKPQLSTEAFEVVYSLEESASIVLAEKLLFSLQHIVFTVKFLIAYVIPDTPADVKMALSRVSIMFEFISLKILIPHERAATSVFRPFFFLSSPKRDTTHSLRCRCVRNFWPKNSPRL